MTTITGSIRTLKSNAAGGAQLRFKYKSAPAYVNGSLVYSAEDVVTSSDSIGEFSVALTAGSYEVSIDGNDADKWIIAVPSDDLSYDIGDVITSNVTILPTPPSTATVPNASTTVLGKAKTTLDGASIRVATGIWRTDSITTLKALPSDASNQMAFLTDPADGEPRIVYWDPLSAVADDPTTFGAIKPTDNPALGRWKPFSY